MAISQISIELRNHPRTGKQHPITCSLNPGSNSHRQAAGCEGILLDLAQDGAGLLLDQPYRLGAILRIDGIEGRRQAPEASVRWVRKLNGQYRVGVVFHPDGE